MGYTIGSQKAITGLGKLYLRLLSSTKRIGKTLLMAVKINTTHSNIP